MTAEGQGNRRPLEGVRVLAVEQMMAGPYASLLLADAGAEVIKIEQPGVGDMMREVGIIIENPQGQRVAGFFIRMNRQKKSITLDLKKAQGQQVFKDLVRVSDVVLENFRPGVMDSFGVGYGVLKEINPALLYVSVSGFGHLDLYQSPYWDRPAFDMVVQAMSGLMYRAGREEDPPLWGGWPLTDQWAGTLAAFGVILALRQRDMTGKGQHIDISMYDGAMALNERAISDYLLNGREPTRGFDSYNSPYGPFRSKDGYVVVAVVNQSMWIRLCKLLEREDLASDPELATGIGRFSHEEDLIRPLLEGWLKDKTKVEAAEILTKNGVAAGPVQTVEELLRDPHVQARRMLIDVEDHVAGRTRVIGNPVKMTLLPEPGPASSPLLGEHTEQLLKDLLGLGSQEIDELRTEGVI